MPRGISTNRCTVTWHTADAQLAFGKVVQPRYDFTKADIVLSLDCDFLTSGPANLRYTADFMSRRRVRTTNRNAAQAQMNRLYVAETAVTCTGAKAEHRLALGGRALEQLARAIAIALEVGGAAREKHKAGDDRWVVAVAKDLLSHRGRSLVLAGNRQPPVVHLLAHAINDHLGNVGQTVSYSDPVEIRAIDQTRSIEKLVDDMAHDKVEMLLMLGGNPVYTAPANLEFAKHLDRIPLRVHHSQYVDETSRRCQWHLPETHFLEAWSDVRAFDGTISIAQPLIEPLYQGRSAHEVLELLAGEQARTGREIVRDLWRCALARPRRLGRRARRRRLRRFLANRVARRPGRGHGAAGNPGRASGGLATASAFGYRAGKFRRQAAGRGYGNRVRGRPDDL